MDPTTRAILLSWPIEPQVVVAVVLAGLLYIRGWAYLRRFDRARWTSGRLASFLGGLVTIFVALCSPIDPLGYFLVSVHMFQHVLLMFLAPPLLLWSQPYLPLLAGLPAAIRQNWVAPFLRHRALVGLFGWLTGPVPAWLCFVLATWIWHAPALYELALRIKPVHYLEHAFFFTTALLFWYPVIQPYPGRLSASRWALVPYLFLAGVQGTALSGILTFADHVIYPHYLRMPGLASLSPLEDQALAGAIMWIPGSIAYLIPLCWISYRLLTDSGHGLSFEPQQGVPAGRLPASICLPASRRRVDVLRVPVIGTFLRWRHARPVLELPLLVVTTLVIVDGLTGPQVAPLNLAGVVPWIYWRGLTVIGLLVAANLFCMACPFMLPRKLAKHLFAPRRPWPPILRSKWLAVALLVVFFWAYEALSLWDSPWRTAWLILGYFITAWVIDAVFRDAAFCKYLCPAGQFQMVQSLTSPLEVRVRDMDVCLSCQTKDCIRGRDGIIGCEMHLFQQHKSSNLDCSFRLDCIHACPHDNVGILSAIPGRELWRDTERSGIGRFSKRTDVAALVAVLVFAAFANAAGMIAPAMMARHHAARLVGLSWMPLVLAGAFALALVVVPLVCTLLAAALTRRLAGGDESLLSVATRYAYALLPIGASMWVAHYSFHLFTSADALFPAARRFLGDWQLTSSATMAAMVVPQRIAPGVLLRWEILCLDMGLLLSMYVAYRIGLGRHGRVGRGVVAALPWAVLSLGLFVLGVWILFQPMQMRGMMAHGN
jgi:cytochrome c oxidase assembly factor CtaG/polyferredoxin